MTEAEVGQTPRELASGSVESGEKGKGGRVCQDDCENNGVTSDAFGTVINLDLNILVDKSPNVSTFKF